ncbi:DUF4233 domain-containing protein [Phycicoccus avicenniae]|uniref:DUF4233 domain-containing protein n=1 Tax=Phycicoccus avicenniae TaxID=2828860 RepID=UPI003D2A14B3
MRLLPLVGTQGKFTVRLLAMTLIGQAVVLSFFALVVRAQALAEGRDDAGRLLWVGLGLAALAVVAGGLMRGPLGLPLGWLVQVLTWVSAVLVPAMIGVAVVFTGLWVLLLVQGVKADELTARRASEAAATAD